MLYDFLRGVRPKRPGQANDGIFAFVLLIVFGCLFVGCVRQCTRSDPPEEDNFQCRQIEGKPKPVSTNPQNDQP